MNRIAQTVIDRGMRDLLLPVIAITFRLYGLQDNYYKEAMKSLSRATLRTNIELLCAVPRLPFDTILDQWVIRESEK